MYRKHFWPVTIGGAIVGALVAWWLAVLPKADAEVVLIAVVGIFGGVYFGVALSSTSVKSMVMNITVAAMFAGLALAGGWINPLWFAAACFAHAAWDVVIDHPKALHEPIAQWYMPICVSADILLGAFILFWWW